MMLIFCRHSGEGGNDEREKWGLTRIAAIAYQALAG
jgi:hypothetical protein